MRGGLASSNRGQSSVIGIALIIGLTIGLAATIIVLGGPTLTGAQDAARADQAEQSMTQLDARASTVSLGSSPSQRLRLSSNPDGQVSIDSDAGAIEVLVVDDTGAESIVDADLGAVRYETGETTVAYQGGGVWRSRQGRSVMVTPPEYRYNDDTLTFPIVQVTGREWSGSPNIPLQLQAGDFTQLFPTATRTNPLERGHVHVKVTSDYHDGWAEYFTTRTDGVVNHQPSKRQVTVNLTVPFTESFEDPLTVTANDSVANRCGGFPDCRVGDRPSADPKIEAEIAECERDGCRSGLASGSLENGTYYTNGSVNLPATTFNTTEGDISVVVDGDLEFSAGGGGRPGTVDHYPIVGDGAVTIYVTGDVSMGGQTGVNTHGDVGAMRLLVHSDGDSVNFHGTPHYRGVLYAPDSDLELRGTGATDSFVGAAVVNTASGSGNIEYSYAGDTQLTFEPIDTITYLQITKNEVNVASAE